MALIPHLIYIQRLFPKIYSTQIFWPTTLLHYITVAMVTRRHLLPPHPRY